MKLTWLGHSCFLLEEQGYRIVTDPYRDVEGYPPPHLQAHAVFCSHGHFDHAAVEVVERLPERPSPFAVRTVETFHDDRGGADRGPNRIHVFTAGGVSVAHLGDLGHQLDAEQLRQLGAVDVLLVPVGGVYTVDAAGAKAVCDALRPRLAVPMHYRHGSYGFGVISTVTPFLEQWDAEEVRQVSGNSLDLPTTCTGVAVLTFHGNSSPSLHAPGAV